MGLVDTPVPGEWARHTTTWAKARWELRRGPRSATKKLRDMTVRHSRSALSRLGMVPPSTEPGWFDSDGSKALFSKYQARPHDVPLVVFTASESGVRFGSSALGWDNLHGGTVETQSFDGDHFTIMSGPSVEELARAIEAGISAARAATEIESSRPAGVSRPRES